jgi:hypothetical protein
LVSAQGDGGGWLAAVGAGAIEELSNRADAGRVSCDGRRDGGLELGGRHGVEDGEEPGSDVAEVAAALGGASEEDGGARRGAGEAVNAARCTRAGFAVHQVLDVGWVFELLASVPGTNMGGDDGEPVEHANGLG